MGNKDGSKYDVIVIGAGHNGLVAAAHLAKAGRKVLMLERGAAVGGLAASEEFHPGYRSAGVLHDTTGVRHSLIRSLNLKRYGLQLESKPPSVFAPQVRGRGLLLHDDPKEAAEEIAVFSERDAENYVKYRAFIKRVRRFVNGVLDDLPPDVTNARGMRGGWEILTAVRGLRKLGRRDMSELFRIGSMSAADWLDGWFETDLLKALIAGPAVFGAFMGPRSPGSALNLLIWECRKGPSIKGGAAFLATALEGAARAFGVDMRTGAEVRRIVVADGRVRGVSIEGGETIEAKIVAASCDPKQVFLQLLPGWAVPEKLEHRLRHFRSLGTMAKVHIGLKARVEMAGRPGRQVEFVRTGQSLDQIERSFDAVKYRRCSDVPILDIYIPTFSNPGFAPEGHTVMSVLVHFAPYDLEGGWGVQERERLGKEVVDALCRYAPPLRELIDYIDVLTPADLELRYGLTQGHVYHGEHAPDQLLVRPAPECSRYATPIEGLYLCGSGSHPGGGITCAPGALAARAILNGG